MKTEPLIAMLKRHEGFSSVPYKCSAGSLTIGYGRNLEANGITEDEALLLLVNDMQRALNDIQKVFPDFLIFSTNRRNALTDMIFNLGWIRFLTFRKMIDAILHEDWEKAALEAEDSKWFKQVGIRGVDIVSMLRNG